MQRRDFLKGAGVGALTTGGLLAGAPAIASNRRIRWRMVTAWPPNFPIFQEGVERFAAAVNRMSDGQLTIQVHAGGQLVPPMETFSAVSRGTVQCGHSASYYWAGRLPAAEFFTTMPFGMNTHEMNAWFHAGDGLELWREVYAASNLIPLPLGNTGAQTGGWFKKSIDSVDDLRGLKIRMPGIGGRVMARAGATPVLLAGGEIYTAFERGVVDAVEWVGPYFDMRLGLHEISKACYYPGWQEPCGATELIIHRGAWEGLPAELQQVVTAAAAQEDLWMQAQFAARNREALRELTESHGVTLHRFPDDVLDALRVATTEVVEEQAARDPLYRKVKEGYEQFQRELTPWHAISEAEVFRLRG